MSFSGSSSSVANQVITSFDSPSVKDQPDLFEERLETYLKRISDSLNTKIGGLHTLNEILAFKQIFTAGDPQTFRNIYRKVINFGALPNAGATTVAHGIPFDASYNMTLCYGTASDTSNILYIPLPFSSPTLNENVKLEVDGTNVTITTAIDYSGYDVVTVVMEYCKNS